MYPTDFAKKNHTPARLRKIGLKIARYSRRCIPGILLESGYLKRRMLLVFTKQSWHHENDVLRKVCTLCTFSCYQTVHSRQSALRVTRITAKQEHDRISDAKRGRRPSCHAAAAATCSNCFTHDIFWTTPHAINWERKHLLLNLQTTVFIFFNC